MRQSLIFCLVWCISVSAMDESKTTDTIQPGHILSLQIREDKKEAVQQRVAVTGEIQVPYLGLMKAAGKTCVELAEKARKQLEPTYFSKATVVVRIDDKLICPQGRTTLCPGPPTITILGNVVRSGKYDLPTNKDTTVSAELARAGGHNSGKEVPGIKIVRTTPLGEKIIVVNTHAVLVEKKAEYDLVLRTNDVIIVD
ncbi:MAG: polysaccharide biosynthesis/export family protein [Verrucomicrobiaceae bacterium]